MQGARSSLGVLASDLDDEAKLATYISLLHGAESEEDCFSDELQLGELTARLIDDAS